MADGESTIGEAADAAEEASDTKALDVVACSGFAVMALQARPLPVPSAWES